MKFSGAGEPPTSVKFVIETPYFFYVACVMAYSLQLESAVLVISAWICIAARVIHMMIHLMYDRVYLRLSAFLTVQAVLIVIRVLIFMEVVQFD